MKQFSKTCVSNGKYDDFIITMLGSHSNKEILNIIMQKCNGHENPEQVIKRIELLQKQKEITNEYTK